MEYGQFTITISKYEHTIPYNMFKFSTVPLNMSCFHELIISFFLRHELGMPLVLCA